MDGYFNFLGSWFAAFAVPPFLAFLTTPGSFDTRISAFLKYCLYSVVWIIVGLALGYMSVMSGFMHGVLFVVFVMPGLAIIFSLSPGLSSGRDDAEAASNHGDPTPARTDSATAVLLPQKQVELDDSRPKGSCPACKAFIPLDAAECPKCNAFFGEGAVWKITSP